MIRKPSFASLLVSGPGQLKPFHAQNQSVAIPTAPPAGLRYGSLPPGIAQSSRFTGGVVQHQPAGQVFAPPDFQAPSYSGMFPSFSPNVGGSLWGGPTFKPIHPPGSGPPGPGNPPLRPTGGGSNFGGGGNPSGAPGSSGGYHRIKGSGLAGVLGGYSGGYSPYNPSSPSGGSPASAGNPMAGYGGSYVPLGAALAAAAAAGRRGTYYE